MAVASLRFESGALGCIEASTAAFPGASKRVEVQPTLFFDLAGPPSLLAMSGLGSTGPATDYTPKRWP